MKSSIAETFELLLDKNNVTACGAAKTLQEVSEAKEDVYLYIDRLDDMLDSDNSYVRNRALTLIAANARWYKDFKLDEIISRYLRHVTDVKPITARQCIKGLPEIAAWKPELRGDIIKRLERADVAFYAESMRHLVEKDIRMALKKIKAMK